MAEKVKVDRVDVEIIEYALTKYDGDKEKMFNAVSSTMIVWHDEHKENLPLMINQFQLAQVLINGYEIEQTPEEELARIYQSHQIELSTADAHFNRGIKTALHILGIKIKGINE